MLLMYNEFEKYNYEMLNSPVTHFINKISIKKDISLSTEFLKRVLFLIFKP